jgi:UDP-N-acetyl-D-glucosamine dehydrogenase
MIWGMVADSSRKLVVVGQGYVGLPLAILSCKKGYAVVGIDSDETKVADIASGISPTGDVADSDLVSLQEKSRYFVTGNYSFSENFDIAVITVPTPLTKGKPDLSYIESAARSIGSYIRRGCLVILESTTYPGTTEEFVIPILNSQSGLTAGLDFFVGYSPERIDPGNKDWGLDNTPKIVSGINHDSLLEVAGFYESLEIKVVKVSGTREAELVKLLENTFRHVNIALVNELAMFAGSLNVDVLEAVEAAATKPFGFMKFLPGPGVGGHCLPVDPSYLSWAIETKAGSSFKFVELANSINEGMPSYVVEKALKILSFLGVPVKGARVILLGLSYKADTRDVRESPAITVGQLLGAKGAQVFAFDNWVLDSAWPTEFERVERLGGESFDMALVMTNHSGDPYESILDRVPVVLDTRNCMNGTNVVGLWG